MNFVFRRMSCEDEPTNISKSPGSTVHLYEQRRAFEMSRFEGKTYREIAQEQNISIKTVEYRISQVLRKLETDLVDYLPIFTTLFAFLFSQPK